MLKGIWIVTCALIGAAIGAALVGNFFDWAMVAVGAGALVGLVLGLLFGRFVPAHEVLLDLFT